MAGPTRSQIRQSLTQELKGLLQDPLQEPNHHSILRKLSNFGSTDYNERRDLDRGERAPVTSYLGKARWSQPNSEGYSGRVVDILQVLRSTVGPTDRIVDVGSGYGRFLALGALALPQAHFHGLEIVPERVTGSKLLLSNLGLKNASVELCDVSHPGVPLPPADQYYIYWALNLPTLKHLLSRLEGEHLTRRIILRYNRMDDEWPRLLRDRGWVLKKLDVDLFHAQLKTQRSP